MSGSRTFATLAVVVTAIAALGLALLAAALLTAQLSATAAAAPYPPTSPCTLAAVQQSAVASDGSASFAVTGSGLGPSQPVRLGLLASPQTLGWARTDGGGDFATVVRAPVTSPAGAPITATTAQRSCTVPPVTAGPGSQPGDGTGSGTGGPNDSGPAGGSVPGVTGPAASDSSPASGSPGAPGASAPAGPGGSSDTGASGPASAATSGAPGTQDPSASSGSGSPSAIAREPGPGATHGLPTGLGLLIAAVLLVLGTLAVLLLTRRPEH